MTNDYKQNLLDYVTGNLTNNEGQDIPSILQSKEVSINLEDFIRENYPDLQKIWRFDTIVTRGDYYLIWGQDFKDGINNKDFIVVLDKKYKPVKFIDTYASGTPLNVLWVLDKNDNGVGRIIGIESVIDKEGNSQSRFVILNDFTLENFQVRVLRSYYIPKYEDKNINIRELTRNPNEAKYFMVWGYDSYDDATNKMVNISGGLEFVNNVGSKNEWNFYKYTGDKNPSPIGAISVCNWNDDGLTFKILESYDVDKYDRDNYIKLLIMKSNKDGETLSCVDEKSLDLPIETAEVISILGSKTHGSTALLNLYANDSSVYLYKLDLNTYEFELIQELVSESASEQIIDSYSVVFFVISNQVYYTLQRTKYNYHFEDGKVVEDEYIENSLELHQIYNDNNYTIHRIDFNINHHVSATTVYSQVYNLISFGFILSDKIYSVSEVFNSTNYNGEPYSTYSSLLPNSSNLYNSNGDIIFSRNLYNKTLLGNQTTSVLNVPNNYLNNEAIAEEDLISVTNNQLVNNKTTYSKNIYENLFINFVNTINLVDRNKETEINNQIGATRINKSINGATKDSSYIDYFNSTMLKIRITYKDNTIGIITGEVSRVKELNANMIKFSIFSTKEISSVDLISYDESTTYANLDVKLEPNKLYIIKQYVTIEGLIMN